MATAQDRKQLLEEMWNRCGEVSALIIDMKETLYPRVFCETEIEYLLERLRYVRFSLDEQSIMRIIEACDPRKTLGEFAPALAEELRNRGLEGISRMTLREFFRLWKDMMKKLKRQKKEGVMSDIYHHLDHSSRLVEILREEVMKGEIKSGTSEERAREIAYGYTCP